MTRVPPLFGLAGMLTQTWLDAIPIWGLIAGTVLLVLLALEGGFRLALWQQRRSAAKIDAPIGSVIGSILGLLAFLLAFTFGMAASRFEDRRALLLEEVNALGTCYLRADLVPEPQRTEIRRRLRAYVHLRAGVMQHPESLPATIARSEELQAELWSQARLVAAADGPAPLHALFIDALNHVLDDHTQRIVVGQYRIPGIIWTCLYLVSCLSMGGVGYQFGRGGARDLATSLLLAISYSIVIGLIADLDRVGGTLRVSQRPMIELDRRIGDDAP